MRGKRSYGRRMTHSDNKLIFEHNFDGPMKIQFDDDSLRIDSLSFSGEHNQSCCERVYADFSVFKWYEEALNNLGIVRIEVKAVEDMGLVFFFYEKASYCDHHRIGVLVNCYNEQNGYYSNELTLVITKEGSEQRIDVSKVVYDKIS